MRTVRDLLMIVLGLGIPLMIHDLMLRLCVVVGLSFLFLAVAVVAYLRQRYTLAWVAAGLFMLQGAVLAITCLRLEPKSFAYVIGLSGAVQMGIGYVLLGFSRLGRRSLAKSE